MKREIRPMGWGESKTFLDCEFHTGFRNSNYWIPDCLSLELAFRIPIVSGIPDSLSCIPDVKTQVSRFHKQKISRFRKPAWFAFISMGRWDDLAFSGNPYQERIMGFRLSYPCWTYTHTTCLTSNGDLCRSLHLKVRLLSPQEGA